MAGSSSRANKGASEMDGRTVKERERERESNRENEQESKRRIKNGERKEDKYLKTV